VKRSEKNGAKVSLGSALSKYNTAPFHVLTDGRRGSVTKLVTFRDVPQVSDFDGVGATWFKPANLGRRVCPSSTRTPTNFI
jgi:hypothetical protein